MYNIKKTDMKKILRSNLLMMTMVCVGVLTLQSCKDKENEVTVKAQIEEKWNAQKVETTLKNGSGDGILSTDENPEWSITFDDGDYSIDGDNDIIEGKGTYEVNGDKITLDPEDGSPMTWEVENLTDDELIATYTDVNEDGEAFIRIVFDN